MSRSLPPSDSEGSHDPFPRRDLSDMSPAAIAAELLKKFHDIQALKKPEVLVAYYQSAYAAWKDCRHAIADIIGRESRIRTSQPLSIFRPPSYDENFLKGEREDVERQAGYLKEYRKACATRMHHMCLEQTGQARRDLYSKFMATFLDTSTFSDHEESILLLKTVPLWFYWGSWK